MSHARSERLGRQIVFSVVRATALAVLLALVGVYVFYGVALSIARDLVSDDPWIPYPLEMWVVVVLFMLAVVVAGLIAMRLARRIAEPLDAVATGARRIADGDLAARAEPGTHALPEALHLVENFNLMAERLERASGEIARWNSLIAHELRTPVTILRGRLQGVADGVFEPDAKQIAGLLRHVDGLARLIDDLRTVSLLESGHLDCRRDVIDLAREIELVVEMAKPGLESAGFHVELHLASGAIPADAARIRQALLALLENARCHATPGRLLVTLHILDNRARIAVEDDGPGLPPDFAESAFLAFHRRATLRGKAGTGLGLSVVRGIAQAHGGIAGWEAGIRGSRFIMELPQA